jgi:hypothetical protein
VIQGLTEIGLEYVLGNLRQSDEEEMRATIYKGSAEATARLIWSIPGPKWEACTAEGEPAAVGGFVPVWPGLGSGWLWGTDHWESVALEVTRAMKRHILPSLDRRGVHRIEARPMAGNSEVIRWLGLIGFKQEAVTVSFGQGRQDFVLCARVSDDRPTQH